MTDPDPRTSPRRAARAAAERAAQAERAAEASVAARHARRRVLRMRRLSVTAVASALVVGGAVAVTTALTAPAVSDTTDALVVETAVPEEEIEADVVPMPADGLPSPNLSVQAAGSALCDDPAFTEALASGDDATVIAAAGGAEPFRAAVATGAAPCVPLDDPTRTWVVVNKLRPYAPVDYSPADLVAPEGVRALEESTLRTDAAAALTSLVRAAAEAGAGELASESAFRSYSTQQTTYSGHVGDRGAEGADLVSARPGFSEHQSGLTVDLVPCAGSCATIDDLAGSPQGDWVVAHAWEHGWIVRYEAGRTDVTGYEPEPWHLRYIGTELAAAYHEGAWTTLEEFFGLPAAPDYAG